MDDNGRHHEHDHGNEHDRGDHHPEGFRRILSTRLKPHSHDHCMQVDQALESSVDGMRALKISLIGLGATALLQLVVVAFSGSVALLADTIHNFADALTAVPLAVAFRLGRRAPTRRYTYGFGRAEDLAGICIVATIAFSAAYAGWEALRRLVDPQPVNRLGWVAAAGLVGFIGNAWVASYRIRVGSRIGSAALVADGHHARTDALTSLAVILGAAGVALGIPLADPAIGLLITVAIVFILKDAATAIYRRLMDSVDPELVGLVEDVLNAVEGIHHVDAVRIRWVGHELWVEAEVVSEGELSLAETHQIAEEAHHQLLHKVPRLARATIHSNPKGAGGPDPHELTAHHFRKAQNGETNANETQM
ncbi:MAG: cation diffusion facilitator family transporter [Actinomycetota bacterium]